MHHPPITPSTHHQHYTSLQALPLLSASSHFWSCTARASGASPVAQAVTQAPATPWPSVLPPHHPTSTRRRYARNTSRHHLVRLFPPSLAPSTCKSAHTVQQLYVGTHAGKPFPLPHLRAAASPLLVTSPGPVATSLPFATCLQPRGLFCHEHQQ